MFPEQHHYFDQNQNSTLFLLLNHSENSIRLIAIQNLVQIYSENKNHKESFANLFSDLLFQQLKQSIEFLCSKKDDAIANATKKWKNQSEIHSSFITYIFGLKDILFREDKEYYIDEYDENENQNEKFQTLYEKFQTLSKLVFCNLNIEKQTELKSIALEIIGSYITPQKTDFEMEIILLILSNILFTSSELENEISRMAVKIAAESKYALFSGFEKLVAAQNKKLENKEITKQHNLDIVETLAQNIFLNWNQIDSLIKFNSEYSVAMLILEVALVQAIKISSGKEKEKEKEKEIKYYLISKLNNLLSSHLDEMRQEHLRNPKNTREENQTQVKYLGNTPEEIIEEVSKKSASDSRKIICYCYSQILDSLDPKTQETQQQIRLTFQHLISFEKYFDQFLIHLFKQFPKLMETKVLQFIGSFIIGNSESKFDNESGNKIEINVQINSLKMASAIMLALSSKFNDFYHYIPNTLCLLNSNHKLLKKAGFSFAKSLLDILKKKTKKMSSYFMYSFKKMHNMGKESTSFLKMLIKNKTELIANTAENALSNFIQNHATEGIIDLCIFHLGQFQSSLAQFLLISCFNEKKLGSRMKDLFPLMKRLFEKTKNQDSNSENQNPLTFFEWKILDYLLSCLSNSPLKQLFESDNEMFQFYLELIKCPLSQSFEIKNENDNENEKKKKVFSVQKSAISLVGSFYEQIEESYQYQILLSLIETKAVSTNPEISNLIQETIDKIGISSKFASKLLSIPETLKGYSEKDSPQKRRHLLKKETNEDNEEQFLSRIIHTLELLKSIENEEDKQNYLACLLDTLEFFLDSENPLSKHSSSEYIQQLILLVVRNISEDISSKSHSQNIEVAKNQISKINLLVKCIQISDNPQTHNLALIALCSVAKIFPREVLKDIINIFVFIGTKILKREDNYTFAIVKRTIKMIIPVVMKEGSINPESILDVFIENFNHIPSQQQLHLFVSLLESMNIDSGLSIVVKKLFTISTNQFKLSSKNNSDHPLVLFAQNLCTQFEPKIQIISFIEVLKNKIEKHQKEEKKSKFNQKKQIHQNYLNFIEWTTILDFISKSIRTNIFLEQLITISNSKEKYKEIQDLYVKLFEHLLISLTTIKINYSNSTKYKEIKKASEEHSKLVDLINEIFHGLNKLLSVQSFFQIILDLIKKPKNDETSPQKSKYRNDMEINQQILLMFNEKVDSQHLSFSHEDVLFLMGMVKDFIPFLKEKTTKENIVNQQMIVFNIDTLCNYFGDQDTSTFSEVFPVVLELIERNTKNKQIVPSGLMCLATISKTVKTMVLEYLPRYFPLIFKSIYFLINYKGRVDIKNGKENININIKENQKNSPINDPKSNEMQMEIENSKSKQADKKTNRELEERNLLAISGLTSLQEVLNNFPNFASPHLQKVLTALLHPRILKSKNENIYSLVTQIFMIMAEKIQAQHIIAPILKTFKFATVSGTESLCYLFDLLKNVCLQTDFKTAREYDKELLKFFLASFDLRNNLDAIGSLEIDNQKIDEKADIDLIEKHLITAFLSLVLKLNESHFKPIFLKILHWASSDSLAKQDSPRDTENQTISEKEDEDEIEVSMSKHLVLFKISKELILKLKSIFVPYLEYLVDISCLILEKTKKISAKYIQLQNATIINIIDFLHQCFLYDSDGIIGKEKFDRFLEPLVDQLDSQMESEEKPIFEKRVNSHLIPCLGQLVVTSSDDIFWKSLTHQVLLKSRSQDPVVRLAVIKTIYEFYDRLGEEYVTLLPESISFIAELMEDSNIHVEKQCQKLISKIETYLGGESIKKYLI
ncbi:heat repeat-containing protein [Anaeramoeba ignava]|uniref:HEAT repeat-containing protein 1 n=1 Tax=Anaeramoeba ignava TaxID=1746090 RepID=A0A9Q0R6H9_ANAIG|nr:heat repeat-containing protein [Anaeramoeba ignava]